MLAAGVAAVGAGWIIGALDTIPGADNWVPAGVVIAAAGMPDGAAASCVAGVGVSGAAAYACSWYGGWCSWYDGWSCWDQLWAIVLWFEVTTAARWPTNASPGCVPSNPTRRFH